MQNLRRPQDSGSEPGAVIKEMCESTMLLDLQLPPDELVEIVFFQLEAYLENDSKTKSLTYSFQ